MRLRLPWVVFGLLVPTLAFADDHNADYYSAFSWGGGGSTVLGVHQTFAKEFHPLRHDFAVIPADFSVQFADRVTQVIYMAGARYTLADNSATSGSPAYPHKGLFQVLIGTVYTNDAAADFTSKDFGVTLGVGYEYARTGEPWSVRFMYDRIGRFGDRDEWFNRFSTGLSYRWTR
jgi:hypothetical protein